MSRKDCLYIDICKDSGHFTWETQEQVCAGCPNFARKAVRA